MYNIYVCRNRLRIGKSTHCNKCVPLFHFIVSKIEAIIRKIKYGDCLQRIIYPKCVDLINAELFKLIQENEIDKRFKDSDDAMYTFYRVKKQIELILRKEQLI